MQNYAEQFTLHELGLGSLLPILRLGQESESVPESVSSNVNELWQIITKQTLQMTF